MFQNFFLSCIGAQCAFFFIIVVRIVQRREKAWILYGLFLLAQLPLYVWRTWEGEYFHPPIFDQRSDRIYDLFDTNLLDLAFIFYLWFFQEFQQVWQKSKRIGWLCRILQIGFAIAILIDFSLWATTNPFDLRLLVHQTMERIAIPIGFVIIAFTWQKGDRSLRYFWYGSLSMIISFTIANNTDTLADFVHWDGLYLHPDFWAIIGLFAEMFWFTLGLSFRDKAVEAMQAQRLEALRQQIALDFHDEIGAKLTKISLGAQVAAMLPNLSVDELRQKLQSIGMEAKALTGNLGEFVVAISPRFDGFQAIQTYFHEQANLFFEDTPVQVAFNTHTPKRQLDPAMSPEVKRQLYFIFKETLNNIAKHADATEVEIEFQLIDNQRYMLKISDNGRGFDLKNLRPFGNGLNGAKSRAESIKALVEIESAIGQGSSVTITGRI